MLIATPSKLSFKSFNCNGKTQQKNLTQKDAFYFVRILRTLTLLLRADSLQYVLSMKRKWLKWKKLNFFPVDWILLFKRSWF